MLLRLVLPVTHEAMAAARIDAVHPAIDQELRPGARLFDFTVGLDAAAAHDCPPVTHYRMTSRETAWLRRIEVAEGETAAVGAPLALLSSSPDEPIDGEPGRGARVSVAAILQAPDW